MSIVSMATRTLARRTLRHVEGYWAGMCVMFASDKNIPGFVYKNSDFKLIWLLITWATRWCRSLADRSLMPSWKMWNIPNMLGFGFCYHLKKKSKMITGRWRHCSTRLANIFFISEPNSRCWCLRDTELFLTSCRREDALSSFCIWKWK